MSRVLSFSLLFLAIFVPAAWTQETPRYAVFGGGSYAREDLTDIKHINAVGWHASVDGAANHWLSAVYDFSGVYSSPKINLGLPAAIPINSSTYLYLFGPRFTYRRWEHLTPFAEILVGVGNLRFSASSVGLTNTISSTTFAGGFGGGVDYAISRRIAIRLIEVDYVPTRFRGINVNPDTGEVGFSGQRRTQNNIRASAGIVVRFGSR